MKLEECVEILSGYAFKSKLFNENGHGMPLIRIRDVTSGQTKTFYNGEYSEEYVVEKGDFLISMDGEFKVVEWKSKPGLLNQRVCKITPNNELIDSRYLLHMLPKELKRIEDTTSFVTVKHLSVKKIKAIQIPLPPLPIQKKIAAILDAADAYRQQTKALIEKYDELTQSLFLEMFGDPVRNEKGWEMKKFGEVGICERGKSKHRPRNAPELLNGPYPLIQTGDVANSGGYIKEYNSTYSELGLKQSRLWPAGTLCITIAANIAKTGILTFDACFPDSVVGFKPNKLTNNEYVQTWMSFLQKIIETSAPESAQKNINLKILRELEFMCPPIEQQAFFAKMISKIEDQKEQVNYSMQKSEELFQSLLQKAFKGELIN
jgi:type I restriction enzyme S subunit